MSMKDGDTEAKGWLWIWPKGPQSRLAVTRVQATMKPVPSTEMGSWT